MTARVYYFCWLQAGGLHSLLPSVVFSPSGISNSYLGTEVLSKFVPGVPNRDLAALAAPAQAASHWHKRGAKEVILASFQRQRHQDSTSCSHFSSVRYRVERAGIVCILKPFPLITHDTCKERIITFRLCWALISNVYMGEIPYKQAGGQTVQPILLYFLISYQERH